MKRLVVLLMSLPLLYGCGIHRKTPVKTEVRTEVVYRDSVIIKHDTVSIEIPVESHSRMVRDSSSHLETSVAYSDASVDSEGILSHSLTNKEVSLRKEIVYQDRIIVKDSIIYQNKEIPVEVERIRETVPKWCWYLLGVNLLAAIGFGVKTYSKLRLKI